MRFKTIIKITSEANNKNEALDLVEDYLAGNITSGVDMRCSTKPVCSKAKIAGSIALSIMLVVGIVFSANTKLSRSINASPGASAVQAPLKTSNAAKSDQEFKKEWKNKQTKAALDYIKQ